MPKQTELSLSYSVGVKANIGNYESGDAHCSISERWDVTDMTDDEIALFEAKRYIALHELLGDRIQEEYKELKS